MKITIEITDDIPNQHVQVEVKSDPPMTPDMFPTHAMAAASIMLEALKAHKSRQSAKDTPGAISSQHSEDPQTS